MKTGRDPTSILHHCHLGLAASLASLCCAPLPPFLPTLCALPSPLFTPPHPPFCFYLLSHSISCPLYLLPTLPPARSTSRPLYLLPTLSPAHSISSPLYLLPTLSPAHSISCPLYLLPTLSPAHSTSCHVRAYCPVICLHLSQTDVCCLPLLASHIPLTGLFFPFRLLPSCLTFPNRIPPSELIGTKVQGKIPADFGALTNLVTFDYPNGGAHPSLTLTLDPFPPSYSPQHQSPDRLPLLLLPLRHPSSPHLLPLSSQSCSPPLPLPPLSPPPSHHPQLPGQQRVQRCCCWWCWWGEDGGCGGVGWGRRGRGRL
ncbi:unnamed protein product [Closterium sp. NIES-54]